MTRKRKALVGVLLGAALLVGGVATLPAILWSDGVDYSRAASIRATPEFQDSALLDRAFHLPVASLYRRGGIDFQRNGSFCGPTTVVNLLRSLGEPADQATILDRSGVSSVFGLVLGGLTLDQEAELVRRKTGRKVTVLRDLDLAAFRGHLAQANDPARRYLVNFHRGPLFAQGGGHHSPVGGYLAAEDLVLVVDVNRKYQPWLVKTERLHAAVDTVDPATRQKRGLLLVE